MAYYCLHEFHILPSEYLALPRMEQAFIAGSIQVRQEAEKKKEKQIKKPRGK